MDGEPVGNPSASDETDGDGGGKPAAALPKTYTAIFRELWPQYLMMGMSHAEYWLGEASLARDYREAFEMRQKREEWARWRQGAYFYDALLKVAPVMRAAFGSGKVEPGKYPNEPWPLTEKEAKEMEERNRIKRLKGMLEAFKREGAENAKKRENAPGGETEEDGRANGE